MTTLTLQGDHQAIEQVKLIIATFNNIELVDTQDDELEQEDTRTEAEIAETLVQNIKAIKEGKIKHRGFTTKKAFMEAFKRDLELCQD